MCGQLDLLPTVPRIAKTASIATWKAAEAGRPLSVRRCNASAAKASRLGVTFRHCACRYAGAQLERLVALSVGNVSEAYLRNLQSELEKCDRLGSSNRDLPVDEDVSTFSEIVGSAENAADVSEMVEQLAAA